jgi:UPF0755 protein
MSARLIKVVIVLIVVSIIGYFGYDFYQSYYVPYSESPVGELIITVQSGDTINKVAETLAEQRAIKDKSVLLFFNQFQPINNLQTGEYKIQLPAGGEDIFNQLSTQNQIYISQLQKLPRSPVVRVTIKEGDTFDDVLQKLQSSGLSVDIEQMAEYAKNPLNFNQNLYPFLPVGLSCQYGNLSNCAKYYIEGYMYPDTYEFFQDATIPDIFNKFLTNFKNKVWNQLKSPLNLNDFTNAIIMASVIEKETGRPITGVDSSNIDELNKERKLVASVFYNRLKNNMNWSSDPTVLYGSGKRLCQQTIRIEGCLFLDSPEANNLYNTYANAGHPVGPITSPQWSNILAALEPEPSEFLFFVSDGIGQKYFANNSREHEANILKVQSINRQRVTS